jgi:predicted ATPase
MSASCGCNKTHVRRRVVLTGGPGAGKTAVLELIRQRFCKHVKVLPESAGILFGGGFPRGDSVELRQAAQRAIFYVQRELEVAADADSPAIVICDRGTVDGSAYWVGDGHLWSSVETTVDEQIRRYDAVIHLRTPQIENYNHRNPLRIESAEDAVMIDKKIEQAWHTHPRRFIVEASPDFLKKAVRALEILRSELPECCRSHVTPMFLKANHTSIRR